MSGGIPVGQLGPDVHEANARVTYMAPTLATKLLDGLFIGTMEASQDTAFVLTNKIARVVNCCGHTVPNLLARFGLRYLTFSWPDVPGGPPVFDQDGAVILSIFRFIEAARANGESVLVHSLDGTSRAVACVAAYLLVKFRWPLKKVTAFIRFRRPEANPKLFLLKQLRRAAAKMGLSPGSIRRGPDKNAFLEDWEKPPQDVEEQVIRNTVVNSFSLGTGTALDASLLGVELSDEEDESGALFGLDDDDDGRGDELDELDDERTRATAAADVRALPTTPAHNHHKKKSSSARRVSFTNGAVAPATPQHRSRASHSPSGSILKPSPVEVNPSFPVPRSIFERIERKQKRDAMAAGGGGAAAVEEKTSTTTASGSAFSPKIVQDVKVNRRPVAQSPPRSLSPPPAAPRPPSPPESQPERGRREEPNDAPHVWIPEEDHQAADDGRGAPLALNPRKKKLASHLITRLAQSLTTERGSSESPTQYVDFASSLQRRSAAAAGGAEEPSPQRESVRTFFRTPSQEEMIARQLANPRAIASQLNRQPSPPQTRLRRASARRARDVVPSTPPPPSSSSSSLEVVGRNRISRRPQSAQVSSSSPTSASAAAATIAQSPAFRLHSVSQHQSLLRKKKKKKKRPQHSGRKRASSARPALPSSFAIRSGTTLASTTTRRLSSSSRATKPSSASPMRTDGKKKKRPSSGKRSESPSPYELSPDPQQHVRKIRLSPTKRSSTSGIAALQDFYRKGLRGRTTSADSPLHHPHHHSNGPIQARRLSARPASAATFGGVGNHNMSSFSVRGSPITRRTLSGTRRGTQ